MGITVEEIVDKVKEWVESSTEYIDNKKDEKNTSKSEDIYEKEDWYHDVGAIPKNN